MQTLTCFHTSVDACLFQNGFTPLYMAAQEGHVDVVRTLLSKGANQQCTTEVRASWILSFGDKNIDSISEVYSQRDHSGLDFKINGFQTCKPC